MSETVKKFRALQDEAFALFKAKNRDYGDSFKEDGILGVMIRAKDKLNRLISLARAGGEASVKTEDVRDTLIDNSNYSLMAIIAHEEGAHWETEKIKAAAPPEVVINCFSELERADWTRIVNEKVAPAISAALPHAGTLTVNVYRPGEDLEEILREDMAG